MITDRHPTQSRPAARGCQFGSASTVADANGEVGLVAIAFGPDAQPEKVGTETMSAVNLGDFDASSVPNKQAVLHRVYRYGAEGGDTSLACRAGRPGSSR